MKKLLATIAAAAILVSGGIITTHATATAATGPITYAVAGDSISDPTYTALPATWWNQLQASGRGDLASVGGFAFHGYTSAQIAANMPAVTADVLVIEVGTNDVRLGVPTNTTLANLDLIVAAAGDVKHVLVVATPPSDVTARTNPQLALNKALLERAAYRHWGYADPFNYVRDIDGTYQANASVDGVHGTFLTNTYEMQRFAIYIRQAVLGFNA